MALLAAMGPRAYNTGATVPITLSGIASVVLLRMGTSQVDHACRLHVILLATSLKT